MVLSEITEKWIDETALTTFVQAPILTPPYTPDMFKIVKIVRYEAVPCKLADWHSTEMPS